MILTWLLDISLPSMLAWIKFITQHIVTWSLYSRLPWVTLFM